MLERAHAAADIHRWYRTEIDNGEGRTELYDSRTAGPIVQMDLLSGGSCVLIALRMRFLCCMNFATCIVSYGLLLTDAQVTTILT